MIAGSVQAIAAALALVQTGEQSPNIPQRDKVMVEQLHERGSTTPPGTSAERTEAPQVTRAGSRSVAAENLSSRPDSRPDAAAAIGGKDRCDPADSTKAKGTTAACARPIESRAADYRRGTQAVSPELRLLLDQDPSIVQAVTTGPGGEHQPGTVDDAAAAITIVGTPPPAPDGGLPSRGGEAPPR